MDKGATLHISRPPLPLYSRAVSEISYSCYFDGSFYAYNGVGKAGVGISIFQNDCCLLSAAIPVVTKDAQRTEALGPAIAALFLSLLPRAPITFYGDSAYVIGLLAREFYA